ncbi:MAG: 2-oxoglutarate dehydrogenase complex dihydrolipoyllysine-residue succinyltransferase [Alphaproteobacteria bacterium]|nr:2-oxoglutarate dehydrogenase complex dihydrolipoyllysine-residue succinyltransferase [Alphaproteobacteria bacterium]
MATKDIVVPTLGESVSEATIAKWFKKVGDAVKVDEPLCELETDKVTVEVPSPAAGALKEILAAEGSNVGVGAILGKIEVGASGAVSAAAPAAAPAPAPAKAAAPVAAPAAANGPAVTKMLAENPQVNPASISASGKDGRITKGDVITALEGDGMGTSGAAAGPREERVKMTKLRQTIARRLKDSQNTAAILTTFNEIDMTNVIALRNEYKDEFEKKHGIKLGFMGFFIKAAVNALKQVPAVNAEIAGDDIIYKNYYDIGVAVGGAQGLVVPVVRDCDKKSLAQIEADIAMYADKARSGTLSMAEMTGGTFTVSNGGVYGSLMSTPIVNPPQSGILGMHKTEERPVAVNGQVVIRPMMYVALSYDHRIIDGRESVTFLVKVKQAIEDPRRLLLGL